MGVREWARGLETGTSSTRVHWWDSFPSCVDRISVVLCTSPPSIRLSPPEGPPGETVTSDPDPRRGGVGRPSQVVSTRSPTGPFRLTRLRRTFGGPVDPQDTRMRDPPDSRVRSAVRQGRGNGSREGWNAGPDDREGGSTRLKRTSAGVPGGRIRQSGSGRVSRAHGSPTESDAGSLEEARPGLWGVGGARVDATRASPPRRLVLKGETQGLVWTDWSRAGWGRYPSPGFGRSWSTR